MAPSLCLEPLSGFRHPLLYTEEVRDSPEVPQPGGGGSGVGTRAARLSAAPPLAPRSSEPRLAVRAPEAASGVCTRGCSPAKPEWEPPCSPLSPQPLATTDLFTVSTFSPLLECHVFEMVQCVARSDGFFHLVLCISDSSVPFHGLTARSFSALSDSPSSGRTPQPLCPLTC